MKLLAVCYHGARPCEQTMEKQMLDDVKELFQAFIAPQLEGIKGYIRALDTKITALDQKIDMTRDSLEGKIEGCRRELIPAYPVVT